MKRSEHLITSCKMDVEVRPIGSSMARLVTDLQDLVQACRAFLQLGFLMAVFSRFCITLK